MMKVRMEVNLSDYHAFCTVVVRYAWNTRWRRMSQPSQIWTAICIMAAPIAMGFAAAQLLSGLPLSNQAAFAGGVAGSFVSLGVMQSIIKKVLFSPDDRPGLVCGVHEVSLNDQGILDSGWNCEVRIGWPLVQDVVVAKLHAFVMLDGMAGLILPRRSFESPSDFDIFVDEIRRRAEASKSSDGATDRTASRPS
jgi:hypothetical protein